MDLDFSSIKKRTITLSVLTVATAVAGLIIEQPAMAQGARFQFEPNRWEVKEPVKSRYLNQQPPATRVGHGSMPKGSSFLGVDPSFLTPAPKPAQQQPMQVVTNARPSVQFGQPHIIPKPQAVTPTAFNPGFGAPQQQLMAHQPPAQNFGQPAQANPSQPMSNSRGVSARLAPPRHASHHSRSAVAGRLMKPKQPQALHAVPKIANYGSNLYTPGSTKPQSSGYKTSGDVYGRVLNK